VRRSQKRKKTVKSSSFFALSGSASIKAARKTLMKLTPDGEKDDEKYRESLTVSKKKFIFEMGSKTYFVRLFRNGTSFCITTLTLFLCTVAKRRSKRFHT